MAYGDERRTRAGRDARPFVLRILSLFVLPLPACGARSGLEWVNLDASALPDARIVGTSEAGGSRGSGGSVGSGGGASRSSTGGLTGTGGASGSGGLRDAGSTDAGSGDEDAGDAGSDTAVEAGRPVVTAVATRDEYTCALLSDGTAKCWGDNIYGVLGYGTTDDVEDPAAVGPISVAANPAVTVSKLSAGWYHVCAVLSDGSVKCWGYGHYAELGYGNTENVGDDELPSSVGPVSITNAPGVAAVSLAEGFLHGCALLSDSSVKCWGSAMGLGLGRTDAVGDDELPSSVGPVSIAANAGVTVLELAAGESYTCALLSDGTVKCWGNNQHGQLGSGRAEVIGDDELPSSVAPVSVTTTPDVYAVHLAGGFEHVCALLSDGSVKCWGNNDFGQLGYGNTDVIGDDEVPSSVGPVNVTTNASVRATAITAGGHHTCALLSNGMVQCWGLGSDGRLGYGDVRTIGDDELPSSVGPVSITTTPGVAVEQIAAGGNHTCAVLSDGSLKCWGYNHHGQLGYGNTENIGDDELPSSVGPVRVLKD